MGGLQASQHSYFPSKARSRTVSGTYSSIGRMTKRSTNGYKIGFVQDSAFSLKKKSMSELGAGVFQGVADVSFVKLLEWIQSERLTTLPHKGSRWDRVLIRALYFAEQLHKFDTAIQGFALDSHAAATLGHGHAQLLLELGHENSEALDKAFAVLYKFGLSLSAVLHRSELLAATSEIREQLCLLYTDLLSLVVDVAVRFYKTVNGMTTSSVSLDIYEIFGETIETFRNRQNTIIEAIWSYQIDSEGLEEGEVLDVKILNKWLAPQDGVVATLSRDHAAFTEHQAEFTCLWFQRYLPKFVQSDHSVFLVTGRPGSGKTVLAGAIAERFQRPVSRKSFDTLFCSINPEVTSHATSLGLVKSLLVQLLNLRVGNMAMYYALSQAYQLCQHIADNKAYEDQLWHALAKSLEHPLDNANELAIIVDGLDELSKDPAEVSAVLGRLRSAVAKGKRVRLIVTSSSLSSSATDQDFHHDITPADVRDDLHAVVLKALIPNKNFQAKSAKEQESLIDRIIQVANGSFLWATITCEILSNQKSSENITKTLENLVSSKAAVPDLVLKLFNTLDLTSNAKTILSWQLVANRPFTVEEIHCLFSVNVQTGNLADKHIDTFSTVQSLKSILALQEGIVRFKHPSVRSTLYQFATQGKISLPVKDIETDLVLRILTYTKSTIRDKGEPTLEISDPTLADRMFKQFVLLEYAVHYWPFHLKQSSLAPKSTDDFKPTPELQKSFPESTIIPVLETISWSNQWLPSQVVELYTLVGAIRAGILTESHPAVLQTYISTALTYATISNTQQAIKYFYLSTKISRKVLSEVHPLTLEVANRFLTLTENMKFSSRTEIVTRREEVLLLVITAYERQYGSTYEHVIRYRQLLVELYGSLKEEDRALEVYRLIQEATIKHYGRHSHEAQGISEHLGVVLGKGKGQRQLDSYKESFFTEEEEDDVVEVFDIHKTTEYLRKAEEYISRGDIAMAERTYVELWHEISSRSRSVRSIEWHEKNIDIASTYAEFLRTQKRKSESSAVLTCVWQQYDQNQLSFSETIVSRLTTVAKSLKVLGHHSVALSIFKYASSYYKNVRKEESSMSQEVSREISETSTQLVKQTLITTQTQTTTSSAVSESVFQDVFYSAIKSSKTIDATTMALAKKLTLRYMAQRKWSSAISVIHDVLARTWESFLSGSIQDVTLTTIFMNESIELVELLAECHIKSKQMDKVADVYARLFRAVLTSATVDKAIFERTKNLLINFYDKHGYFDNAIGAYQEILGVYRTKFGSAHENTIQVLYILAARCRAHPRNHPYWVEYYLQIVTNLNKDSDICHPDALEAIIIVANTHWEDRRYAEAVIVYRVLWNTSVRKTKEYKQFSDAEFVQTLYERYFQSLEETKASWSVLHQVTEEYRSTCLTVFGAESTLSVEATLALARVTQQSDNHSLQAIALYEEASKSSKVTTTTVSEIKQTLSSLYVRQMQSKSSSSMKTETVDRAISLTQEQYSQASSQYGYSHESSLTHLRELAILHHRQQKSELATRKLTTAVQEIVTKETSSEKLIESASSIAESFHAIQQHQTLIELVHELHRQISAKDSRNVSKWSLDLTKSDRSSLAFLASLQYHTRKDLSITLAEIMADITMEYIYFESFRQILHKNESTKSVILAAAPLRVLLLRTGQKDIATFVEEEVLKIFMKRDTADLGIMNKQSPGLFINAILEYLGNGKNKNFIRAVLVSSNEQVASLTKAKRHQEAYDVAHLSFVFASKHDGYSGPESISLGFKLASLLVGQNGEKISDPELNKKSLDLSNKIVKKILDICKQLKINLAQIQLPELDRLSALLGRQEDYVTLEWLLTTLWQTRDAQKSWPTPVLITLSRRLICARYLAGHPIKAIRLCEDIAYNMRRAHGPRTPVTIETYELLAQLYTSTALTYQSKATTEKTGPLAAEYFRKALRSHEDILQIIVYENGSGDDSDDELDAAAELLAQHGANSPRHSLSGNAASITPPSPHPPLNSSALALKHLHLLKLAYQRLGSWPKPYSEYERLNAEIFRQFGTEKEWKGAQGVETWSAKEFGNGKAESSEGAFEGLKEWGFVDEGQGQITVSTAAKRGYGALGLGVGGLGGHGVHVSHGSVRIRQGKMAVVDDDEEL
ncbi:NACHT domain-containing protein [Dendryphion nanum]|uniref:NACHT domain-containing protein n=1 Tax=Dendryphion nanum TaxID=256645 RepID=A0A9P9EGT3_9PLEO|nr:NACHT domain-containing protein [Dendryphion nanum]